MAKGEKAEDSENGGLLKSLTSNSLIKGLLDKIFALVGIIIAAMVINQIFAYPEFMIQSDTTYVEFVVPENVTKSNNSIWWKAVPVKSINVSARNYYNHILKNYEYPIFLNYSFVDDKGTAIPGIKEKIRVNIDPKNRQIFTDGESATITIGLEDVVDIQDYNLRIWGRGGGGESFKIAKGQISESVSVESSGRELMHYCTITIIMSVNETKKEIGLNGTTAIDIVDDKISKNLTDSNEILNKKSGLGDEVVV